MNFTTTVTGLYTVQEPQPNYVVTANWQMVGADGTHTASCDGSSQFTISTDEPGFVPFNELTEATVIGWIESNSTAMFNAQQNIVGQINSIINPPVTPQPAPLPWA